VQERVKSIDCIRGIAILAVILIHTTTRTLEAGGFDIVGFPFTLFLNQIARFAVPIFFIISGFVLEISSGEEMSYWSYVKRRFSKIFIPYVFWSLIYYYLVYNNNHDSLFEVFLTGNASYQLYFIPALLVFYLTFPLLHKLFEKIKSSVLLIVTSLTGLILLCVNYYIKFFDLGESINVMILAYTFFILGIVAAKNKNWIDSFVNKFKLFIAVPAGLTGLYVFWEGRSRYLLTDNYLSYYSSWRPSIFVYSILIGLTFYYIFEHTRLKDSFISRFSKHSFFVFFIHVAVLEVFWKYVGNNIFNITESFFGKIVFDPIFFFVIAMTSFLLAKYIHKIPKVHKLLG